MLPARLGSPWFDAGIVELEAGPLYVPWDAQIQPFLLKPADPESAYRPPKKSVTKAGNIFFFLTCFHRLSYACERCHWLSSGVNKSLKRREFPGKSVEPQEFRRIV